MSMKIEKQKKIINTTMKATTKTLNKKPKKK